MLKRSTKCMFVFLALLLIKISAWAQLPVDSSAKPNQPVYANIVAELYKKLGAQSQLYNGIQYDFYNPSIKGNAYFKDINNWTPGTVIYDGYSYNNVSLMYDLYTDQLIMLFYNNFLKVSLISTKISSFDLLGYHFIYVKNDPTIPGSLNTGFYAELYKGKTQILAKYSKGMQTYSDISGNFITYFSPTKDYYLFKEGKYYTVNSQGAFLDALKNHKTEVKKFMRANNIKYKDSPEQTMATVGAYYDSLSN